MPAPLIALVPVVESLAPTIVAGEYASYIASGVASLIHASWNTELSTSGQMEQKFEEQYVEIDLQSSNFENYLKTYEDTQKQTVQEKIDEYVKNYIPPVQSVSYSSGATTGSGTSTPSIPLQKGLIDTMKASSMESIEQQKILNNNLATLNATLVSIFQAKNSEIINQNQTQAILKENLLALNKSMATLATLPKVTAEANLSPKRVISSSTNVGESSSAKSAEALGTIAEVIASGVEDQKTTNAKIVENLAKKNEQLDFLKNGDTSLKDSSGQVIKPREVEAKNNAEQHIDKKAFNTFDNQHLIDALDASETNNDEETKYLLGLLKNLLTGLDNNKFNTDQNQNLFKKVV